MNSYKAKVDMRIFYKKWSKTGDKADNFYNTKNPVRVLIDNLITKKCAKFQVNWMKIRFD